MSNVNAPFGFELLRAEGKENRLRYYSKSTNAIYPGDVLKLLSSGKVDVAAAGDTMIGVAGEYKAASDTGLIAVYDDPSIECFVQASANYTDPDDVGLNADIVANAADTTLKRSKHTVNTSTADTDATGVRQWKIIGLYGGQFNAAGSYAILRVKPNNHIFKKGTPGV